MWLAWSRIMVVLIAANTEKHTTLYTVIHDCMECSVRAVRQYSSLNIKTILKLEKKTNIFFIQTLYSNATYFFIGRISEYISWISWYIRISQIKFLSRWNLSKISQRIFYKISIFSTIKSWTIHVFLTGKK